MVPVRPTRLQVYRAGGEKAILAHALALWIKSRLFQRPAIRCWCHRSSHTFHHPHHQRGRSYDARSHSICLHKSISLRSSQHSPMSRCLFLKPTKLGVLYRAFTGGRLPRRSVTRPSQRRDITRPLLTWRLSLTPPRAGSIQSSFINFQRDCCTLCLVQLASVPMIVPS